MTRKVFNLVSALIGAVQTAAIVIVTYQNPEFATAINSSIVIVGTAAIEICSNFVKD